MRSVPPFSRGLLLLFLASLVGSPHAAQVVLEGVRMTGADEPAAEAVRLVVRDGKIVALGAAAELPEGAQPVSVAGLIARPVFVDAGHDGFIGGVDRRRVDGGGRLLSLVDPFAVAPRRQLARSGVGLFHLDHLSTAGIGKLGVGSLLWADPTPGALRVAKEVAGYSFRLGGAGRGGSTDATTRARSVRAIEGAFKEGEARKKKLEEFTEKNTEWEKELASWRKARADAASGKKPAKKPSSGSGASSSARPADYKEWSRTKQRAWRRAQARKRLEALRASRSGGSSKSGSDKKADSGAPRPKPPRLVGEDFEADALVALLKGEAHLRVVAHWKTDILAALKVAAENELTPVILGGSEAWACTDELLKAEAVVVLGAPRAWEGASPDRQRARPDIASALQAAGVPFAFMTSGSSRFRHDELRLIAALHVAEGLSREAALHALTHGGARALGAGAMVGQPAVGAHAALQFGRGDPLGPDYQVHHMLLGDKLIDLREETR